MDRDYRLGFSALEREVEIERVPVEGAVPGWLSGTLIRNGPGTWDAGEKKLQHWFDGLAMLHRFGFRNGSVSYSNRFLDSPQRRYLEERGEIGYSEFATDPCRSIFKRFSSLLSSPEFGANASVSVHKLDERFVALTETPLPVEFDPETLATAGVVRFEDDLDIIGSSPHPHTDPATGDYINHATHVSRNPAYNFFRVRPGGLHREVLASIPAREPAYMHSFGQSEHHVILVEYPLVANFIKMLLTGRPYAENLRWKADRPARFHVIDKQTGELTGAYATDPFFCFHHVNSFERDGDLFVDLLAYPDAAVIEDFYMDVLRDPECAVASAAVAELRRYRIGMDPAKRSSLLEYEVLSEEPMEMPRINERYTTRSYRYAYGIGVSREGRGEWLDQLVKADVVERTSRTWYAGDCYPGEPVFVASPEAREEDDGVVLSVVLDAAAGDSFLLVLDAASFEEIARARVPHHIPFGFHGEHFGEAG
ncbi:MAG: carotenoid oxygenase family protein [Rubrobacteraceae bacterium]